jgi:hypothetical protein
MGKEKNRLIPRKLVKASFKVGKRPTEYRILITDYRLPITLQETPRTPTSPRAPGAENAERQTPNAFLSPPTSGTLFDVLITALLPIGSL